MQTELAQGNTTEVLLFLLVSSTNHISPVTGATPTVTISKNGGAFTTPLGTVSEVGNGWYAIAPNAIDANTLGPLVVHATALGADPSDTTFDIVAASFAPPTPAPSPSITTAASGQAPTFESLWRMVRLHCPLAPAMLVRDWCQSTYNRLTDMRPWTWTQLDAALTWQDARALDAVTVTRGSRTVTSAGLFVAGDAGRQFRVGTYPIYTIVAVPNASQITLDNPFEPGDDANVGVVEAQIVDAYATMPAGFSAFTVVVDTVNQRVVPWWGTQMDIDLMDPDRTSAASTPRFLASRAPSTYPLTAGQYQYEYWPIPEEAGALQYYARQRPTQMADDFVFTGVLAHRMDVLQDGALAQAARWPGTAQVKNPYFNLALAKQFDADFAAGALQLDLRDDDQAQQTIDNYPWQRYQNWGWAWDPQLLRMTDAVLGDFTVWGATA